MKKQYESPTFEFKEILFTLDALRVSVGEGNASGGTIEDPPSDPSNPWDNW